MSRDPVDRVVHIVGNAFNTGLVFETTEDIAAIRDAVNAGLLRLVAGPFHAFSLKDEHGAVSGIVLTSHGLSYLGIDEKHYYKK